MDKETLRVGELDSGIRPHIIIASSLENIGKGELADYLAHAYCYEGCCTFTYNNKVHTLAAGDCLILRRGNLVESLHPTEDFHEVVI